jgi:hypothetical protein
MITFRNCTEVLCQIAVFSVGAVTVAVSFYGTHLCMTMHKMAVEKAKYVKSKNYIPNMDSSKYVLNSLMGIISWLVGFEPSILVHCHYLNPADHDLMILYGSLLNSLTIFIAVPVLALVFKYLYSNYTAAVSSDRADLLQARLEQSSSQGSNNASRYLNQSDQR